ncbi:MAG: hypothetical protein GY699_20025, partial [Desulfobacteraceae bacterium]|nr:hypothetical protein [Desulfobacteraceae bacterium]
MNFTFSDVSSSFLNMIQQDLPKEIMFNADSPGSQNQMFSQTFNKTLEKARGLKDETPPQINPDPQTKDTEKIIESLSEELDQEKGVGFVSALRNFLLMFANGDLKNISIDPDGLAALKKLLLKAGFKENDIDDLMAELTEKVENGQLTLDDLFKKLFELDFESIAGKETDPENTLETSAVPFLESILNSLGISKRKIEEILAQADRGKKGINIDVVIEN